MRFWGHVENKRRCSTLLFNFLQCDALPVPLLRQVYADISDVMFPHVFIAIFTKSAEKWVADVRFPHVFIALLL